METLDLLRKLPKPTSEPDAWSHGVDCALKGANRENSHFSIFRTPERRQQWEAGKQAAEDYLSLAQAAHPNPKERPESKEKDSLKTKNV